MRKRNPDAPVVGEQKRTKIPWIWIVLGVGSIWWVKRYWDLIPMKALPKGAQIQYAMQPTQGTAGQLATLSTYRLIQNRRDGMAYAPVTQEAPDGTLTFTVAASGTVTRNVVVEGNNKYVEVAVA